jgi:hypothetical protein
LAKSDSTQFEALGKWLSSYNISDLLVRGNPPERTEGAHPEALFSNEVVRILPKRVERRMGMIKESYAGYEPLDVPDFRGHVDPSKKNASPMKALGGAYFHSNVPYNIDGVYIDTMRCRIPDRSHQEESYYIPHFQS